jgi:hypothetical protein
MAHHSPLISMSTRPSPKSSVHALDRGPHEATKRYTCSLPLALASRLEALLEMHPETTRSQLIGDLLGLGLAEVERTRSGSGLEWGGVQADRQQPIYLLTGPFSEFHKLTQKHHLALERERCGDDLAEPGPSQRYLLGDATDLE